MDHISLLLAASYVGLWLDIIAIVIILFEGGACESADPATANQAGP